MNKKDKSIINYWLGLKQLMQGAAVVLNNGGIILVIAISKDSSAEELVPIAMAFHELLGLPVTMRSFNKKGVRIEKGKLLDDNYTGPVLEQVLQENCTIRTIPKSGAYSGIPVVASPVRDEKGYAIAAIGVVDVVGTIDLGVVFGDYPDILGQVQACLKGRVIVP